MLAVSQKLFIWLRVVYIWFINSIISVKVAGKKVHVCRFFVFWYGLHLTSRVVPMFYIEPLDEVVLIYLVFFVFLPLPSSPPQLWFCTLVPVFTTPAMLAGLISFSF